MTMKTRQLGSTGITLSEISFGGAAISGEAGGYGFGAISENESVDLVLEAVDQGINHFDTAPIYGFGESEKRLGKALKNIREKVYITSKSGITWHDNKRVDLDNSTKTTQKMLEQSLRDLQSDYIDFYFIHWPDPRTDIRYPMEVLAKAKDEGKIRYIGLSNTNIEDYTAASEIEKVDIIQGQYNFLCPDLTELKDLITQENLGVMSWGSFHKGILTGTIDKKREYSDSDCRKKSPWWKRSQVNKEIDQFEPVKNYLEQNEIPLDSFALGFILKEDWITTAMVGMRKQDYITKTLNAYQHMPEVSLYHDIPQS